MYKVHDRQSLENMKLSIYVGKHVLCISDLNTCMVYIQLLMNMIRIRILLINTK